jgi:hypothetical protein
MNKKPKILKYPRLLVLALIFAASAWFLYEGKTWPPLHDFLVSLDYLGLFGAGLLYAYGFTAAPATAILLVMAEGKQLLVAALVAGLGALISDVLIYFFVRQVFVGEIQRLTREQIVRVLVREQKKLFGRSEKIFPVLLGTVLIASPLPTEMGVTILASVANLKTSHFIILAGLLHFCGILVILAIGQGVW